VLKTQQLPDKLLKTLELPDKVLKTLELPDKLIKAQQLPDKLIKAQQLPQLLTAVLLAHLLENQGGALAAAPLAHKGEPKGCVGRSVVTAL